MAFFSINFSIALDSVFGVFMKVNTPKPESVPSVSTARQLINNQATYKNIEYLIHSARKPHDGVNSLEQAVMKQT